MRRARPTRGIRRVRAAPSAAPARDQDATPFAAILEALVARVPGALAAALVDVEGETVDYAGALEPFDVKVAAAHLRIVLATAAAQSGIGALRSLVLRGERRSFIVCPLPDAYAMVVILRRRAGFTASSRALYAAERALCREAGWRLPGDHAPAWCAVDVDCDRRRRPAMVRAAPSDHAHRVDILGAIVGLPAREVGFRVRLDTGAELTLVREPGGFWYADSVLDPKKRV